MTLPTREQVDASLARTEALTWSERDIIILAAEVRALREELEEDGAVMAGLRDAIARLDEDVAALDAHNDALEGEVERLKFVETESNSAIDALRATIARVEALPAKWSQASEATPKLLRDGWRQCARELGAALKGECR